MKMPTWLWIGNSNSKGLFVGRWFPMVCRWLICIRHQIIPSFQLWCVLGGEWRAPHDGMPKWVWTSTTPDTKLSVQTSSLPPRVHRNVLNMERCWKQNNQLPTKRRVELKDNSRVLQGVNSSCSFRRLLKMFPPLVHKDKTKKTFEISMQWFSKVYKYMDLRAPKQLMTGIVQTLEKSCCCLLYTTPEVVSCKLDLFNTRKSC